MDGLALLHVAMSRLVDVGTWLHAGSFQMTLSECATIGPESRAKTPDVPAITKSLAVITTDDVYSEMDNKVRRKGMCQGSFRGV
jgi:hypothetical protein